MLTVKEKGLLLCIVDHCKRIEQKMDGVNQKDFFADEDVREIICFNLLQIGELANKFTAEFLKAYPDVPWKNMRGMRNRIVHGYGTIRIEVVWDTATKNIKPLRDYCESILKQ